ncbi:MAG: 50S ribosomal protein L16 [Verrucomicrobiales bacterium]|jgi:large subunit ribosomal protein L16|nr:50S ribosomal protein L16 [Verrucomicrobiales bacterium]MCH2024737.1 50S ribosomal protein L16 [Verrucomicrobiales bacterium]MEC9035616.1 50S ribosomal protein L16 [Verrucomicrobiota bacterium]MED5471393.1 50S ribosomal protein L16 [Verrucomicrobiota bacterium]HAA87218.1 50S ribosomal protein L16 [Verrucomicrobiales bacterium]|tara:strand:+ start:436 stop:852 length:417 start_codon:yes stop_codon:yes gene_type:complete
MPLMPRKVKYRKSQRGSRAGNANRGTKLSFGDYGLQTLERGWIKNNQIEACRVTINRYLKRKGKVWIRIFPHKPTTSRPPETRMGKGKGAPEHWVAVVRPGLMLFEIGGVSETLARDALRRAANKLGVSCRFVSRDSN